MGQTFFSQGDLPKHFCDETKDLFFVTGANSIPLFSFLHYCRLVKVRLVEETLMYNSQHTAKFEFSHLELRVRLLLFGFLYGRFPHCKTLAIS